MKYKIEDCIGSRLRGLSRTIDGIYRKRLQGLNITENQLSILMALYKTGKIEQIELGKILKLERSSLSRNLVRLMQQHLIEKDGAINRPMLKLTALGQKKVEELTPIWEQTMDEIYQMLGGESIAAFSKFEKGFMN